MLACCAARVLRADLPLGWGPCFFFMRHQVETAVGSDARTAAHDRQRQPVQHQAGPHHGLQLRGVPVHRFRLRAAVSQAAYHQHNIPPGAHGEAAPAREPFSTDHSVPHLRVSPVSFVLSLFGLFGRVLEDLPARHVLMLLLSVVDAHGLESVCRRSRLTMRPWVRRCLSVCLSVQKEVSRVQSASSGKSLPSVLLRVFFRLNLARLYSR